MYSILLWCVLYREALANTHPLSSVTQKNTYVLYFHVVNFSVSSLWATMQLNLIFHFDVTAATSVFSYLPKLFKWIEKEFFNYNCFVSICLLNCQENVIWCIKSTLIVHSNLYFNSAFTFSVNYVGYRNRHRIAVYRDIIMLWPMYHDVHHIMRSLLIPTPSYCAVKNLLGYIQVYWDAFGKQITWCRIHASTRSLSVHFSGWIRTIQYHPTLLYSRF